jgi:hypothetical protein
MATTPEHERLREHRQKRANWKNWGPYLSDRSWGTVRHDYSADGEAWLYFPHEHARSRAYRWDEDGLFGISDRRQYLCFGLGLWNGRDPILKERLFGLTGLEGNHGEDVKELYYYLDSTPTHSYMKMLYRYPQRTYPYEELVAENARRGHQDDEYELWDSGIFSDGRHFDVVAEYAKVAENDLLIEVRLTNCGPEAARLHLLPQLWFRNTWSWGYPTGPMGDVTEKPILRQVESDGQIAVRAEHAVAGTYYLYAEGAPQYLFTENETNRERLYGEQNESPFVKDAFHRYLVGGETGAVNPARSGTKVTAHVVLDLDPGKTSAVRLRLLKKTKKRPFKSFGKHLKMRRQEADQYYAAIQKEELSDDERLVQRQAFAGMLLSKQLYYFDVDQWLSGDPGQPPPPEERKSIRNRDWRHLHNFDVISMPDKWEYPWYAAWDLAFHCIPLALVDPDFAKRQLTLLTREWYMHPNGQLPAYEWSFGDVNPPVHAWAARRVYQIDAKRSGTPDRAFLEGIFHKLLLNFTWWVNRKDADGNDVFQGGFLGLDNISVFDRSKPLPTGGHIDQSDGTAWMGFFSLTMMQIALELAREDPVYQDIATKFFEHFLGIAHAMNNCGGKGYSLWDDEDGFFYDMLHLPGGEIVPLKVRSLVGLLPLLAVESLEQEVFDTMPDFARRVDWFLKNRPHLAGEMADLHEPGLNSRKLASIVTSERLLRVLGYLLDEQEFLSPFGIRSLSKHHQANPYTFYLDGGEAFTVDYQPGESRNGLFGGNSNWRGPVWFPINYLLIEALQRFDHYCGDAVTVEFPTGSGNRYSLGEVAAELSRRLIGLFTRNETGERPALKGAASSAAGAHGLECLLFHEYFHAETGAGLGASHQTGWTGLVAKLIDQSGGKNSSQGGVEPG